MKLLAIVILISININWIMTETPVHISDSKQDDTGHKSDITPPSADLAGLFWMNHPRCDSVSHDLRSFCRKGSRNEQIDSLY